MYALHGSCEWSGLAWPNEEYWTFVVVISEFRYGWKEDECIRPSVLLHFSTVISIAATEKCFHMFAFICRNWVWFLCIWMNCILNAQIKEKELFQLSWLRTNFCDFFGVVVVAKCVDFVVIIWFYVCY